jgi:hypothetical protein
MGFTSRISDGYFAAEARCTNVAPGLTGIRQYRRSSNPEEESDGGVTAGSIS